MRVVVLTGAGISAESGLATFRGPGGLWEGHRPEDLATPTAFARDPATVHRFYDMRRARAAAAQPNAAHAALARLQDHVALTLVTQNVDDLHARAGSRDVIHMHGRHAVALCLRCDARVPAPPTLAGTPCPDCGTAALRPDVVWFGEMPHHLERIGAAIAAADLFAAIGTSGRVYPAAGLMALARRAGARTVEINLEPSAVSGDADEVILGPATEIVPAWVTGLVEGLARPRPPAP